MPGLPRTNFTEERLDWDRADVIAWLDESRPKKNGKPDKSKPHTRTESDARTWAKSKNMKDGEVEKFIGDLPSYD